ncbi:hypothetical protein [Bradyrhizobium sp. USDA 4451]
MKQKALEPSPLALLNFLRDRMAMTAVYQPVIIRELLIAGGKATKDELARALIAYDAQVTDYYTRVLMRYPRSVLESHGVIRYDASTQSFDLVHYPETSDVRQQAVKICDERISVWLESKASDRDKPTASMRYLVLKEANGKCELCGISASIRPIDVDHIVPRSLANKQNKVKRGTEWLHVDDRQNLQALCFSCNRAKRDADDTAFRTEQKLVRDRIPALQRSVGRRPVVRRLDGSRLKAALLDKLVEEHAALIGAHNRQAKLEAIADLIEVATSIAAQLGLSESKLLAMRREKNRTFGSYSKGYYQAKG